MEMILVEDRPPTEMKEFTLTAENEAHHHEFSAKGTGESVILNFLEAVRKNSIVV